MRCPPSGAQLRPGSASSCACREVRGVSAWTASLDLSSCAPSEDRRETGVTVLTKPELPARNGAFHPSEWVDHSSSSQRSAQHPSCSWQQPTRYPEGCC